MDEIAVLVLNYTYEPLHFTNARRAVTLLLAARRECRVVAPSDSVALAGVPAPVGDPARLLHPQALPRTGRVQQEDILRPTAIPASTAAAAARS